MEISDKQNVRHVVESHLPALAYLVFERVHNRFGDNVLAVSDALRGRTSQGIDNSKIFQLVIPENLRRSLWND